MLQGSCILKYLVISRTELFILQVNSYVAEWMVTKLSSFLLLYTVEFFGFWIAKDFSLLLCLPLVSFCYTGVNVRINCAT